MEPLRVAWAMTHCCWSGPCAVPPESVVTSTAYGSFLPKVLLPALTQTSWGSCTRLVSLGLRQPVYSKLLDLMWTKTASVLGTPSHINSGPSRPRGNTVPSYGYNMRVLP